MKLLVRLFVATGLVVAIFWGFNAASTQAQTVLSEKQLETIQTNCLTIKNSLDQLHASDALLRVNRGQLYESMNTRMMERFNARVSSNGFETRGLTAVTSSYSNTLTSFRSDYQAYERQLSLTLRIDCQEEPMAFYLSVLEARERRTRVYDDVLRLHRYIDDYRAAVSDFLLNFERLSGRGR